MQALEELAVSYDSQDNDIAALKLENKALMQEMKNSKVGNLQHSALATLCLLQYCVLVVAE